MLVHYTWMFGHVARRQGSYDEASRYHRETVVHAWELRSEWAARYGLYGLAYLALDTGRPERSARLLGAADTIRDRTGTPLLEFERADHTEYSAALRDRLGTDAFFSAWREGAAMTVEQATAYALTEEPSPP